MTRSTFSANASLLLALAATTPLPAQQATDVTARVDSIFAFANADTPGCAVAASQSGRVRVQRNYGLADLEGKRPISPNTAFDIGSTHKQFVAASVLLLVEDGKLTLDDDVRRHLPELADFGHRITVLHLLNHTSGIRDWPPLQAMAPEGTDVLALIFRQRELNFVPGAEFSYSNSGYVLLKELVERVSGGSFADFTRRRIFEPLGMRNSSYVPDIMQGTGDRALAYARQGERWESSMRLGNRRGGGTVISTVSDLLIWNEALTHGKLGAFVTAQMLEPARLNNGRRLSYARGLIINDVPGGPLVSHSGGAAGFSTWLGRFTGEDVSVAVMCNFEPVSASQLAERVAELFLLPVDPANAPRGPRPVPGVDVTPRAGLYFDTNSGEPMRLQVNNGRLAIVTGPPLVPVSAESFRPVRPMLFFRSEASYELRFRSADEFTITTDEGEVSTYRRAEPWTPSAADLEASAGRYRSEELNRNFELLPGTNGLRFRFEDEHQRTMELQAVARDTYMVNLVILRVLRDASGQVTGLSYGNPALRRIHLTRIAGA